MATTFTFDHPERPGEKLRFTVDLTVSDLRHIKAWFGRDLGSHSALTEAWRTGDPDAWACIIWIARRQAGEHNVPEPLRMGNFSVTKLRETLDVEGDPTATGEVDPTPAAPEPAEG